MTMEVLTNAAFICFALSTPAFISPTFFKINKYNDIIIVKTSEIQLPGGWPLIVSRAA